MLVAFSVAPAGGSSSDSVHDAVAAAVTVVRASGLPNHTDAMFTTIEGEWDECMAVIRDAVEAVGAYGTRVGLVLKADIRPGHTGEMTGKVDRLEAAIARHEDHQLGAPDGEASALGEAVPQSTDAVASDEHVADHAEHDPVASLTGAAAAGAAAAGLTAAQPAAPAEDTEPTAETALDGPVAPAVTAPAVLARFVAATDTVTVLGSGDDDLPVPCARGARVIVADGAPPDQLGLFVLSRAMLRTEGIVQVLDGNAEAWGGDAGETVSAVVWGDDPEAPRGLWVELAR